MDKNELRQIIREENKSQNAQIFLADIENPFQVHTEVLDLGTAVSANNPKVFNFPFKCVAFIKGTDTSLEVSGVLNSNDNGFSSVPFKNNSSLYSERMFGGLYLSWAAQPGKSVTICLFLNAKFESGSFVNDGTVTVSVPSGMTLINPALASGSQLLLAQNLNRSKVIIQNNSGADIYIGGSAVSNAGASRGLLLTSGVDITLEVTDAIYIYSSGFVAGEVTVMEIT